MSSLRKKPNGGFDKDAPVASTPRPNDAPPAVETKPLEPIDVEDPVKGARSNALRDRIAEMEHAEQLTRESSQQAPQMAEPPPAPQQQAAPQLPPRVQKWQAEHPQFFTDPEKSTLMLHCHWVARRETGEEFTD